MTLVFSTCRQRMLPDQPDMAKRVSTPLTTKDVLGRDAQDAVTSFAQADKVQRNDRGLSDALRNRIGLPSSTLARVEAGIAGTSIIDPVKTPADPRLVAAFGAQACLKHRILPWRSMAGRVTILATSPEQFLRVRDALIVVFGPVYLAIVTSEHLDAALSKMCHKTLMQNAEMRTDLQESCRGWNAAKAFRWGSAAVLVVMTCLILWPSISFFVLCGWAVFTLVLNTILKVAAAFIHLFPKSTGPVPPTALMSVWCSRRMMPPHKRLLRKRTCHSGCALSKSRWGRCRPNPAH